jgi:3-oxoadipate enol-lactonase
MPEVAVNNTTLHYLDDGPADAHAIVCGPSMFFDGRMFAGVAEEFADEYRVIRYDNRGQGGSASHPREELDMDTQAADAAALIEALDLGKVTYVGNSMGGFTGLRLAARRPDLLRSVVVMGTSADVETEADSQGKDEVAEMIAKVGMTPEVVDAVIPYMLGDTSMNDPSRAAVLAEARAVIASRTPAYADSVWQISHRTGILDELPAIDVPLMVIAGLEDNSYAPEKAEQIVAAVPHARLEYMERTGHVHALENPDAVNALLREHLSEVQP